MEGTVDDQRLRVFAAVAASRSFTAAARALHLSQSGVSTSVRALEREVGTELFDRSWTPIALTPAGAALLPEAISALRAMERARQAVTEVVGGLRGTLRLGILYGLTPQRIWTTLSDYRARHPAVDLRITGPGSAGSADHVARLRTGDLDAAVVISTGSLSGLRQHTLLVETLVLACPPDHPIAIGPTPALRAVADQPLIDFPRGWGVRSSVDEAFAAAGVTERRTTVEMNDITTILHMVRLGVGLAFVPATIAPTAPDLTFLHLPHRKPGYRVTLALPAARPASPAAVRFTELALDDTAG